MTTLPTTMRAMAVSQVGPAPLLHEIQLPVPECADEEVLIEVHASGMNPIDCKLRAFDLGMGRIFPSVFGFDVSGVIRAMGAKVSGFALGEAVFGLIDLNRQGCNAQYVTVNYRSIAPKPAGISHTQAAAIPIAGLTAWIALVERCKIKPGQTVFINAAAGGVGHFGIQIARMMGCQVIAGASRPESIALCQEMGAHHVINYKTKAVSESVQELTAGRGAQVVFDTAGGDSFVEGMKALAVSGNMATIVPSSCSDIFEHLMWHNASLHFVFVLAALPLERAFKRSHLLRLVGQLVERGQLRAHISQTWPLSKLAQAHEAQESGRTIGKMVIDVQGKS